MESGHHASPSRLTTRSTLILQGLNRVYRTIATILTLLVYAGLGPFGYAFFGLMLLWPSKDPFRRARALQAVQSFAFRFLTHWLNLSRLIDIRWTNLDLEAMPKGPYVIVSNHHTLPDMTSIVGFFRGASTIIRPGVYDAWWIGGLVRNSLHIRGTRTHVGAPRVVEDALYRLAGGLRCVFFPEGTRSQPGELGTFSRVPFEIACRADVPVVVVRVLARPAYLTRPTRIFPVTPKRPNLRLTVLDVLNPADFGHDSRALTQGALNLYEAAFAEDPGLPEPDDRPSITPASSLPAPPGR